MGLNTSDVETFHKKYSSAIEKSFKLSHDALTLLQDLKKDSKQELNESKVDEIDNLHKKLVLDNVTLVRNKNEMKLKVADINERLISEKISKTDKQYNNTKLAALKRTSTTNDSLAMRLDNIFHEIPEISVPQFESFLQDVKDPNDRQLLKRLFISSADNNDGSKNSTRKVVINDADVQKGKDLFDNVSKQRSKLVLLNERYYNKKIRELEKSISYWQEQYDQVTAFIGGSVAQIQSKIEQTEKRLDSENHDYQSSDKETLDQSKQQVEVRKDDDVEMKDLKLQ